MKLLRAVIAGGGRRSLPEVRGLFVSGTPNSQFQSPGLEKFRLPSCQVEFLSDCSTVRPKGSRLHDALMKQNAITGKSLRALDVGLALTRSIVDSGGWDRCRVSALLGCHVGSTLRVARWALHYY